MPRVEHDSHIREMSAVIRACHSSSKISKSYGLFLKTASNEIDVTSLGGLFYMFGPATGKSQSTVIDWAGERQVERFYFLFNIFISIKVLLINT